MKCFYHKADLDGKCSAAIVKNRYDEAALFPADYGDVIPWDQIAPKEIVFVVDFSFPPEEMNKLNEQAELIWIDHHKTAIEANDPKIRGLRRTGEAACELAWDYIFGSETAEAVTLLGRYDVWDKSASNWETHILPFQLGMQSMDGSPENQELWMSLFLDDGEEVTSIISDGNVIHRYTEESNKSKGEVMMFEGEFLGHPAIFCNVLGSSQNFKGFYDKKKHDLMLTFVMTKDMTWKVSMYTESDSVDVSALAKQMGGGGHRQAAGFTYDNLDFLTL